MNLQISRLNSLIEYAKEVFRKRTTVDSNINTFKPNLILETDLFGLPGISTNVQIQNDDGEFCWLRIQRLKESRPPPTNNELLELWLSHSKDLSPPKLLTELKLDALPIKIQQIISLNKDQEVISLSDFQHTNFGEDIEENYKKYLEGAWQPWADKEKPIRKTIALYKKLFMLTQTMDNNASGTPLELVWGQGLVRWKSSIGEVNLPLLTQSLTISVSNRDFAIEITPNSSKARIESAFYTQNHLDGSVDFARESEAMLIACDYSIEPFDVAQTEPFYNSMARYLDPQGEVLLEPEINEKGSVKVTEQLKIFNTWVIFARPQSVQFQLQDLQNLQDQLVDGVCLPALAASLVTDPSSEQQAVYNPSAFRGISSGSHYSKDVASELYFPKPYNQEQVSIIEKLEHYDGVVVQGPPGTGKTHTIANVISHYLANGKRILVSSMKEPALAVLKDKLPEGIRPLAVSVLSDDKNDKKQFQFSIEKILHTITTIRPHDSKQEINICQGSIDSIHASIAQIDNQINRWGETNLKRIEMDGREYDFKKILEIFQSIDRENHPIDDMLSIEEQFNPKFTIEDYLNLRTARQSLGENLRYFKDRTISLEQFPPVDAILQIHRAKQSQSALLIKQQDESIPLFQGEFNLAHFTHIRDELLGMQSKRESIARSIHENVTEVIGFFRDAPKLFTAVFNPILTDAQQAVILRQKFLTTPIILGTNVDAVFALHDSILKVASGKKPFAIMGGAFKKTDKPIVDGILILGQSPKNSEDWQLISDYIAYLKNIATISVRWNSLMHEYDKSYLCIESDVLALPKKMDDAINLQRTIQDILQSETELSETLEIIFPPHVIQLNTENSISAWTDTVNHHIEQQRLVGILKAREQLFSLSGHLNSHLRQEVEDFNLVIGEIEMANDIIEHLWSEIIGRVEFIENHRAKFENIAQITQKIKCSGAPLWAEKLCTIPADTVDNLMPDDWLTRWNEKRIAGYLQSLDDKNETRELMQNRLDKERELSKAYLQMIEHTTWLRFAEQATPEIKSALNAYASALIKISKTGTGKKDPEHRRAARDASAIATKAVPCWIMSHAKVSEQLPSEFGMFDLLIIDEASQSDLTALPVMLRAKKILVVGDDKQVSPDGAFLDVETINQWIHQFLTQQVKLFQNAMRPDGSIYDLFKIIFADSGVSLREHFRCATPIIEFSKRTFYNNELVPLRLPSASERLDPPLIDVFVEDGFSNDKINKPEIDFIVNEIKQIANTPELQNRSIGVVSTLGFEQAQRVFDALFNDAEFGQDLLKRHQFEYGDAKTFQGNEKDIMFVSLVICNTNKHPQSTKGFQQRLNVATSRARDRMYLVRSVQKSDLSPADTFRLKLLNHFEKPMGMDEAQTKDAYELCESKFETDVLSLLLNKGYVVNPQVRVGAFRIDMVVEGENDARMAIECDGDAFHGADRWGDDMRRQRILERAGWTFWRCFASAFYSRQDEVVEDLIQHLYKHGIRPMADTGVRSVHVEQRVYQSSLTNTQPTHTGDLTEYEDIPKIFSAKSTSKTLEIQHDKFQSETSEEVQPEVKPLIAAIPTVWPFPPMPESLALPDTPLLETTKSRSLCGFEIAEYTHCVEFKSQCPDENNQHITINGLRYIIEIEGPMIVKRAYDIYLRGCEIQRMGGNLKSLLNKALYKGVQQGIFKLENELGHEGYLQSTVRMAQHSPINLRTRGNRSLEEIPASELCVVSHLLYRNFISFTDELGLPSNNFGDDMHLREILEHYDLKRLTAQAKTYILSVTNIKCDYIEIFLNNTNKPI